MDFFLSRGRFAFRPLFLRRLANRSLSLSGNVLGGFGELGTGEYLEKTFHNLPTHQGITISLRYLFIDTW